MEAVPTARGRRTRERLLDAAADAFARNGFHATRVDDIVAAVKTSHGTFYVYFPSKEALLDELLADAAGELLALVDELPAMRRRDGDREQLRAWLERFGDLYSRRGGVLRTWTELGQDVAPSGGALGTDVLAHLSAAVQSKLRVLKRAGFDPMVAALALMGMVERLHHYRETGQLDADGDAVLDALCDVVLAAIG